MANITIIRIGSKFEVLSTTKAKQNNLFWSFNSKNYCFVPQYSRLLNNNFLCWNGFFVVCFFLFYFTLWSTRMLVCLNCRAIARTVFSKILRIYWAWAIFIKYSKSIHIVFFHLSIFIKIKTKSKNENHKIPINSVDSGTSAKFTFHMLQIEFRCAFIKFCYAFFLCIIEVIYIL